ncbi:restriction endonuclease subunit S [Campylobacter upsaliensis]|nr:restriction endonuclease subunit S [Campylobacter upsaliensis]
MSIEKYQELIKAILVKCGICHTERSEISNNAESSDLNNKDFITSLLDSIQELESKLDFDLLANYTNPTTYPTNSATCHTEPLGEVSTNTESNPVILSNSEKSKNKLDFSPFSKAQNDNLKALLDSIPIPPKHGWERVRLKQVAFYPQDRIENALLTSQNYVGVDNLLQDKKGKREADFVLDGTGTNNDVVVVRSKETQIKPKFLYYILSDDNFFKYEMQNVKGVKMPRGDKDSILNYIFSLPPLEAQEKIISAIDSVESKIATIDSKLSMLVTRESRQRLRKS